MVGFHLCTAGYTAARLKTQQFSALLLLDGGFNQADLEKAGIDARLVKEILAGKKTSEALKGAGFTCKELRAGGFSASELKASFSAKALQLADWMTIALANPYNKWS